MLYYEIVLASLVYGYEKTYLVWETREAKGSNTIIRTCLSECLNYEQAHKLACDFAKANDAYVKVPLQEPLSVPVVVEKKPINLLSLIIL
jgi:hypothetical protein